MSERFIIKTTGFTLIELIIVIIIMSILAITVFINWPETSINIKAKAEQIANDIRYTQSLSMTKGERYSLVITGNTYQILNSSGSAIILANGSTTASLGSGITFGSLTNLPNNLIAFDGKGTPYITSGTPGTALSATATITLTSGGNSHSISIAPQTGYVIIT